MFNSFALFLGVLNPASRDPAKVTTESDKMTQHFNCWKASNGTFIRNLEWVKLVNILCFLAVLLIMQL